MTLKANYALDTQWTYDHSDVGIDLRFNFPSGTTPVNVTVSAFDATYHTWVGGNPYIVQLEFAANNALVAAGRSETFTASMAGDGKVTFTVSGTVTSTVWSPYIWPRLGLASGTIMGSVIAGTKPVLGIALMTAATGDGWQPIQAGGTETLLSGVSYSYSASYVSWKRTFKFTFQPTNADFADSIGAQATPMYPSQLLNFVPLGSFQSGSSQRWSVMDVLIASRNLTPVMAVGNWQSYVGPITPFIKYFYVDVNNTMDIKISRLNTSWQAYEKWDLVVFGLAESST